MGGSSHAINREEESLGSFGAEGGGLSSWHLSPAVIRFEVFETKGNKPKITMTMLEAGYLLISQGQESLDTISLLSCPDFMKVQHSSDNLMFRFDVKGESHMIRMQFDGSSTAEAVNQCSSAVKKLMEYVPVTPLDTASVHPNQPPTEDSAPETQLPCQEKTVGTEQEVAQGSLTVRHLTQHFLGETTVTLPEISHHGSLEADLRVCLLDPSFPAFVEKVEEELKKLLEE